MPFNLKEFASVPGSEAYFSALKRENDVRDAAVLDLPTNIGGKQVVPMTLRHWVILNAIDSPFLKAIGPANVPTPEQCIQFLWVMNKKFTPGASWRRGRFIASCRNLFYGDVVSGIEKFVSETFQDAPSTDEGSSNAPPQVSFAVAVVSRLASGFGWTEPDIFGMPLVRAFQYMKILTIQAYAARGEKPITWNPSDRIKMKVIRAERERRKQEKEGLDRQ